MSAALMFITTGVLIIETMYISDASVYLIVSGIFAFLSGVVYVVDLGLTFFNYG
jgi:hypothetical protein